MEHALWKGRISFGLVEIPVRLWPAVKANELSFSLLDRRDFSPVGNKRYNKETGKEVPWDDVVRGFEYEPDEYVVLSDEELRRANVAAHETIEIMEFVDQNEIDPMYYETPYYVTPLQKGSKSYALLRDALETERAGGNRPRGAGGRASVLRPCSSGTGCWCWTCSATRTSSGARTRSRNLPSPPRAPSPPPKSRWRRSSSVG